MPRTVAHGPWGTHVSQNVDQHHACIAKRNSASKIRISLVCLERMMLQWSKLQQWDVTVLMDMPKFLKSDFISAAVAVH